MKIELRARIVAQTSLPVSWGLSSRDTATPRVVLFQVGGSPDYHMEGASGYAEARIQADCYGATYAEAVNTAGAVKSALSGWRSGNIEGVFLVAERDSTPADDAAPHRISLDFMVKHQEAN